MEIAEIIKNQIDKLCEHLDKNELALGEIIYNNGRCQILSQSSVIFELIVSDETTDATKNKPPMNTKNCSRSDPFYSFF